MIKRLFKYIRFSRPDHPQEFAGTPMAPRRPIAVIGDIHGRLDCLNALLDKLANHAVDATWIFVGDFIDRGDHSAEVLDRLFNLMQQRPEVVCLLGNHEEMLLWFLEDPAKHGPAWLRYGGLQTLASFGVPIPATGPQSHNLREVRDLLLAALPMAQLNWLQSLPRYWQSGNVAAVHAGADPTRPLDRQSGSTLTWGHQSFGHLPRQDGIWVIHGHTTVTYPVERNGVISIDTGAYATGKLTAALVENGSVDFLQATVKS